MRNKKCHKVFFTRIVKTTGGNRLATSFSLSIKAVQGSGGARGRGCHRRTKLPPVVHSFTFDVCMGLLCLCGCVYFVCVCVVCRCVHSGHT